MELPGFEPSATLPMQLPPTVAAAAAASTAHHAAQAPQAPAPDSLDAIAAEMAQLMAEVDLVRSGGVVQWLQGWRTGEMRPQARFAVAVCSPSDQHTISQTHVAVGAVLLGRHSALSLSLVLCDCRCLVVSASAPYRRWGSC